MNDKSAANLMVLAGYALFAAAGFLSHPIAGLLVIGLECVSIGVAMARNNWGDES